MHQSTQNKTKHNKYAPYWAVAMFLFGLTGVATTWFKVGGFWNGYVLDIMGPAWNYILFRGLFTAYSENAWRRFFTPWRTFLIFLFVSFGIEGMQYFEIYDATFDPWDLVSYVSLLVPLFILDLIQSNSSATSFSQD